MTASGRPYLPASAVQTLQSLGTAACPEEPLVLLPLQVATSPRCALKFCHQAELIEVSLLRQGSPPCLQLGTRKSVWDYWLRGWLPRSVSLQEFPPPEFQDYTSPASHLLTFSRWLVTTRGKVGVHRQSFGDDALLYLRSLEPQDSQVHAAALSTRSTACTAAITAVPLWQATCLVCDSHRLVGCGQAVRAMCRRILYIASILPLESVAE